MSPAPGPWLAGGPPLGGRPLFGGCDARFGRRENPVPVKGGWLAALPAVVPLLVVPGPPVGRPPGAPGHPAHGQRAPGHPRSARFRCGSSRRPGSPPTTGHPAPTRSRCGYRGHDRSWGQRWLPAAPRAVGACPRSPPVVGAGSPCSVPRAVAADEASRVVPPLAPGRARAASPSHADGWDRTGADTPPGPPGTGRDRHRPHRGGIASRAGDARP